MRFRYRLVAAWVLATIASILVAFAAVASVRTAISDPPSALLLPGSSSPSLDLPPLSEIEQTTLPDPEVVDGAPGAAFESDDADGGEVAAPAAVPTTEAAVAAQPTSEEVPSTTVAPPNSTTQPPATLPPMDTVETYETEGGWVTVRSNSQGAFLESASPKPGWTVENEGQGPGAFIVVFKSDDEEIHFEVDFDDGRVKIDIED